MAIKVKRRKLHIKYRGAKDVPVASEGMVTSGKHKGEMKLRTTTQTGKRPKGSIDYRNPSKVYH